MSIPSLVILLTFSPLNISPLWLWYYDFVAFRAQTSLWSFRRLPATGTADFDLSVSVIYAHQPPRSFAHLNPPLLSSRWFSLMLTPK